jgi:predicted glycosyltransferase
VTRDRVAIYAVGLAGIGHAVRARRIAEHLTASGSADIEAVVLTGHEDAANLLGQSSRVRVIAPPPVTNLLRQAGAGDLTPTAVTNAADALAQALRKFDPTAVVSTSPGGIADELRQVIQGSDHGFRRVLALRDIYHPPRHPGSYIRLDDQFDALVVAGPRELARYTPKPLTTSPLGPVDYMGYLAPSRVAPLPSVDQGPMLRCQVGSGRDGAETIGAVLDAYRRLGTVTDVRLRVDLGPYCDPQVARGLRSLDLDGLQVNSWSTETDSRITPTAVISMAGYNSCVEAAWTGIPTLLWPRRGDDLEQPLRAQYFADNFETITVHDGEPAGLMRWMSDQVLPAANLPHSDVPPGFFAPADRVARAVLGHDISESAVGAASTGRRAR